MQSDSIPGNEQPTEDSLLLRARALCGAGRLAFRMGDVEGAGEHLRASLHLARQSGNDLQVARALNALGLIAILRGEMSHAHTVFTEALALARRTGDPAIFLDTMVNLGQIIADLEDRHEMCALLSEAVDVARARGDRHTLAMLLSNLGQLLCFDDQLEAALPLLHEGLAITTEIGESWNVLRVHWCLGHAALWRVPWTGDPALRRQSAAEARAHFDLALRIVLRLRGRWETPYFIEGFALAAIAEGDASTGAWLLGASHALREQINTVIVPPVRPHYERFIALARATLSDDAYDAAHAAGSAHGRTVPIEAALSLLSATGDAHL